MAIVGHLFVVASLLCTGMMITGAVATFFKVKK